jgi:dihydrofolate reductase
MNKKIFSIIVAVGKNQGIGYKNKLIWELPDDMNFFKLKTLNNVVIMGRNTYLSLPKGALLNRKNIVITTKKISYPNCIMANSIEDAINKSDSIKENFIIGGSSIYKQFLPIVDNIYYTEVNDYPICDTWFPKINDEWLLVNEKFHDIDKKHNFSFNIKKYKKK